jgi:hypothetical protein
MQNHISPMGPNVYAGHKIPGLQTANNDRFKKNTAWGSNLRLPDRENPFFWAWNLLPLEVKIVTWATEAI